MSNERGTDAHLGDAALVAAWRSVSTEQPASRADEAILAAARAEVRADTPPSRHRRGARWRTHWQPLAAAAGVVGLAFLLVPRLPTDEPIPEMIQEPVQVPARAPAPVGPAPTARPEIDAAADAPAAANAPARRDLAKRRNEEPAEQASADFRVEKSVAPPVSDAPTEPPAPDAPSGALPQEAAERFPREATDRSDSRESTAARDSTTLLLPGQTASMAAAKSASDAAGPEAWVRRIASLHEAGHLSAAAAELRAFRGAYPDADSRLPVGLRAWARTVDSGDEP